MVTQILTLRLTATKHWRGISWLDTSRTTASDRWWSRKTRHRLLQQKPEHLIYMASAM